MSLISIRIRATSAQDMCSFDVSTCPKASPPDKNLERPNRVHRCGHSGIRPAEHLVQLTASSDAGWVQAVLRNAGELPIDVEEGLLKVAIVKLDIM